ncbi:OmpA family protein [Caldichromatium japonicum]|uniref:OmpA family protein n=1 Tax=Caldichromatium japonicum TaxID=2699430 RepID=A0A6G7VC78_9GAMM|nr:OmpA family protein [Caldichromatium japonicum]QIK37683.1 OmpA family protein [Caldichromatium japonicum]
MPEPTPVSSSSPFWKLIALALLLSLIGIYALYSWYDNRLQAQIAEKDALLVQQSSRIKEAEAKRLAAEEALQASRAEIDQLRAEFQAERQSLNDQIRLLEEARMGLGQDLEGIKAAHTKALAEERRKTAEAIAERDRLQAELTAAHQRVEQLQADLRRVTQLVAETAEGHRKRIAELERHLNERISLARTIPEDAELLRTLQQLGLTSTPAAQTAESQALAAELESARAELAQLHQEYLALRSQFEETQNALEQERAALALQNQQSESRDVQERAKLERIAHLESELAAVQQAHAELQKAQTSMQETLAEREQRIAQLQAELEIVRAAPDQAEALAAAESRIRELEALHAQSLQEQTDLQQALETTRARLTELESTLQEKETQARAPSDLQALAEAQARIETLNTELGEARARLSALEAELAVKGQQAQAAGDAAGALKRLRTLIADLARLQATFTEQGLLVRFAESELRFAPGRTELPAGELPNLDCLAELLKTYPELKARIEGHTDSSGNPSLNQTLSQGRAEAVRAALIARGIDPERLSAQGLGPSRPLAANATAEGRAKNRRVEIYLIE